MKGSEIKINSSNKEKFIKNWGILIFLYVASISLQRLLFLPYLGVKFQLPEFIFVLKICYIGINHKYLNGYFFKPNKFDVSILFFVAIALGMSFIIPPYRPNTSVIGILYLGINYILLSLYFKHQPHQSKGLILKSIKWMGIVACFPVIIGLIQLIIDGHSQFFQVYDNYPLIGDVKRAIGLTASANMLSSILSVSILFLLSELIQQQFKNKKLICLMVLFITINVLTFSKHHLLLLIGIIFIVIKQVKPHKFIKISLISLGVLSFVLFNFSTHILFIEKINPRLDHILKNERYVSGQVLGETENSYILETTYLTLKKTSIDIGNNNFFTGVGVGNYMKEIAKLQRDGNYPRKLPIYQPHSSYLGTYANLGILGLIALLSIVIIGIKRYFDIKNITNCYLNIALKSTIIVLSLEAISTDILNYRHLWVLLACYSFYSGFLIKKKP